MSQQEIEVILTRQLASCLAVPVFLVDCEGDLIYYNEAAESLLGMRFHETGKVPRIGWTTAFAPTGEDGGAIGADALPVIVAINERRAVHRRFWIQDLDGTRRLIEVAAFPLLGQGDRSLGGVAMFWEAKNA